MSFFKSIIQWFSGGKRKEEDLRIPDFKLPVMTCESDKPRDLGFERNVKFLCELKDMYDDEMIKNFNKCKEACPPVPVRFKLIEDPKN